MHRRYELTGLTRTLLWVLWITGGITALLVLPYARHRPPLLAAPPWVQCYAVVAVVTMALAWMIDGLRSRRFSPRLLLGVFGGGVLLALLIAAVVFAVL